MEIKAGCILNFSPNIRLDMLINVMLIKTCISTIVFYEHLF